jgi:hypothetical protein
VSAFSSRRASSTRGQANLPAFAIAVLVVVSTATLSLLVVDGAFVAADRDPLEQTRAAGLASRLVAETSPLTVRRNVVNGSQTAALDDALDAAFPVADGAEVRVTLGDAVLVERGDPTGGATVRRLVVVATPTARTIEPAFSGSDPAVTLPRRAPAVDLTVDPLPGTTVRAVRANGRVVLYDPGGLDGDYTVDISPLETVTLRFDADAPLHPGSVSLEYRPVETRKAVLAVTVDG